ncbi:uncharacterized protein J7T54_003395 [Emericellopsis cladophorae]|uniref:Uncharacterized protein n=1 Tax=Emericellopsis cladophorae TaxID=2686198 RepID=A0A9P9XVK0_9HYPO|nr:uncharacterized protein J7T54_003395 [Emericellopsis cladophorae]KAI6778616.1 hypothetical protein J7T54_003395 [Emericellopsis cladophorae]
MGVLFSRPGENQLPASSFAAGDLASAKAPSIAPYLGINTGISYGDTPTQDLPPIPLEWIVSPHDIDQTCPDRSRVLAWFAITDAVIVCLAIIFAHRSFIYHVSRRRLGRRRCSVWLTWLIPFVCQLIANAAIAGVVGNTPGYEHLDKAHIFTVYLTRPRYYYIPLALLRALVTIRRSSEWDKTKIIRRSRDNRLEFPYADAWITTAISELLLLTVGAIFAGVTWNRLPGRSETGSFMHDNVSYVSCTPAVMLLCVVVFIPIFMRYGEAFPVQAHYGESAFRAQGRQYGEGRHWGARVNKRGEASIVVMKSKDPKSINIKRAVLSAQTGGDERDLGCVYFHRVARRSSVVALECSTLVTIHTSSSLEQENSSQASSS